MTSHGRECSRDPAAPTEYRPVKQTFITHPDLLLHITYSGLDGREETLVTTAAHPFFTLEAQAFVDAQELELGDVFRLASGDTAVVLEITYQRAPDGEPFTTYNFEVEDSHTYFVGEQGVWVHNANSYLLCARLAAEYEKSLAKGIDAAKARSQAAEKLKRLRDQGTIKPDAYDKHLADLNKKLDGIDGKSASKGSASNGQKDGAKSGEKATGGGNAPKVPAEIATELHHSLPKFLGGFVDQVLTKLSKPVHKEFHALLRENLKNAGIPLNVGGRGGSAADWARYMTANPDAQKKAFDAVLEASRAIDVKHGTNIVQDVWRNLIGGNFTPYP